MSEKSNPSSQKARDEALRVLVARGGLTPEQVSTLKLNQVHLATNTLAVEPDEFNPAAADQPPTRIKLDETLQRALIAWLVVRPDGPNDHLFPGEGTARLDVATIKQVLAAAKPAEAPPAAKTAEAGTPPQTEREKPRGIPPEPIRRRSPEVKREPPPPPPATPRPAEPQPVSLDEIEALRKRLTETYDAWAPAVSSPEVKPAPERTPPVGAEPVAWPLEPAVAPLPEEELEAAAAPLPQPEETLAAPAPEEPIITPPSRPKPVPPPPRKPRVTGETVPGVSPSGGVSDRLKGLWESGAQKLTLNLSYRAVAMGGAVLLVVACCAGLAFAGGALLSGAGPAGLLAGASTETPTATETISPSTSTPSPTPTASPSPTPSPSPTATVSPTPSATPTQPPTPTPIIVVVTATPTPEPPATATRVPTNTPEGGAPPPAPPTATPAPAYEYPAPVLLEPANGVKVPGSIAILKWRPVGPLADNEWYAVRMLFSQAGQPVIEGDRVKVPEFRMPDRLFYAADGPELLYRWFVFVERDNPDGSTTQLSPESATFEFQWE